MSIQISNQLLDNFTLKNEEFLVCKQHYKDKSGVQEYRLYSYLASLFDNTVILDIGTCQGRSAVALSHNETNKVISYDIINGIKNDAHIIYSKQNIAFHVKNVLDDLTEDLIKNVKIVMIDIDHYETIETLIIDKLYALNFSGIILLDDITKHPDKDINECMLRLWNSIPYTKYDVTQYGHWSGTGIIVMNDDITFAFT